MTTDRENERHEREEGRERGGEEVDRTTLKRQADRENDFD